MAFDVELSPWYVIGHTYYIATLDLDCIINMIINNVAEST